MAFRKFVQYSMLSKFFSECNLGIILPRLFLTQSGDQLSVLFSFNPIIVLQRQFLVQRKTLNVITLGQIETDYNNQMMTLTEFTLLCATVC